MAPAHALPMTPVQSARTELETEDALRARIFEKSAERVKAMTAGVGAAKLRGIVRRAVRYARRGEVGFDGGHGRDPRARG